MTNEPVLLLDMVPTKTFDNRVFYMYASGWVSPDDLENFENPDKYCDCKSDISATQAEVYREVLVKHSSRGTQERSGAASHSSG